MWKKTGRMFFRFLMVNQEVERMRSLINEKVRHGVYGEGVITEESLPHIKVEFAGLGQVKLFESPYVFESFLTLKDAGLQKEYFEMAVAKRLEWEEKKRQEIIQKEEERLREKTEEAAAKRRKTTTAKKK